MIDFELNHNNLIERSLPTGLSIIETTDNGTIQECIDNFNEEIVWDRMFDLTESHLRIKNGDKFFVAKYHEKTFGHCWLKEETDNNFYIYNVFSKSSPLNRVYGATDMLYHIIKNNTKGTIRSKVDKWNEKSIKVFQKLGFIVI